MSRLAWARGSLSSWPPRGFSTSSLVARAAAQDGPKFIRTAKGNAAGGANPFDQADELAISPLPPVDMDDEALRHRDGTSSVPAAQGSSQSHSMSSQFTRSFTCTKLNLPLPFTPANGPVPPSRVTLPAEPVAVAFQSQRA